MKFNRVTTGIEIESDDSFGLRNGVVRVIRNILKSKDDLPHFSALFVIRDSTDDAPFFEFKLIDPDNLEDVPVAGFHLSRMDIKALHSYCAMILSNTDEEWAEQ